MGPRNVSAIQAKLRSLRNAIGWPVPVPAIVTAELEESSQADMLAAPLVADAAPVSAFEPIVERTGVDEVP